MSDDTTTPAPTSWPHFDDPEKLERIIEIIAEEGGVDKDKITPDATLETLGIESMDVVMILMGVEDKLDTYLPMDAELAAARNLSEFVAAIDKAIEQGGKKPESSPS